MSSRGSKSQSNHKFRPKAQPPPPDSAPAAAPVQAPVQTPPVDMRYGPRTTKLAAQAKRQREEALVRIMKKHPIQRLPSPSPGISGLVHFSGMLCFSYSFRWLVQNPNPINQAYGWHFQYLTIIGLTLAFVTFIIGFAADVFDSEKLFLVKNLFSMCSTPMEVLISILYWGIRAIDSKLVVPPEFELPILADLSFHLAPAAFLFFDLMILSPPWTITVLPSVALSSLIAFAYWFWIDYCYSKNGFYPYPMFDLLDTTGRVTLFAGSALVMALNTAALKWVYGRLNGLGTEKPGELKKTA